MAELKINCRNKRVDCGTQLISCIDECSSNVDANTGWYKIKRQPMGEAVKASQAGKGEKLEQMPDSFIMTAIFTVSLYTLSRFRLITWPYVSSHPMAMTLAPITFFYKHCCKMVPIMHRNGSLLYIYYH